MNDPTRSTNRPQTHTRTRTASRAAQRGGSAPTITLEDDIESLLTAYRREGQPLVSITYESPKMNAPSKMYRTMETVKEKEEAFSGHVSGHMKFEREMLSFGYENVPIPMRPIEAMRRFLTSRRSDEENLEMIVGIGEHYTTVLHEAHAHLTGLLKEYGGAAGLIEDHVVKLEDTMIKLSDRKEDVEGKLAAIERVKQAYVSDAPHDGSYAEKVLWRRGLRAIEKDERSLRSLNLRITRDLNQAIEFHKSSEQLAEMMEINYTMNSMGVSTVSLLADQLDVNLKMYLTSSRASDHTIRVHEYLERAAGFSNLMSRASYERMNTVGKMLERFTMPDGKGAKAISGGGLVNGLRDYLDEMQQAHDALIADHSKDMMP